MHLADLRGRLPQASPVDAQHAEYNHDGQERAHGHNLQVNLPLLRGVRVLVEKPRLELLWLRLLIVDFRVLDGSRAL